MSESRAVTKYAFIDAIRGFAFVAVLVFHAGVRVPGLPEKVLRLSNQGNQGVQLFFLASALTLFLSMDSRRRAEHRPVRNFFIRRFFRIAPLFYSGAFFYFWYDRLVESGNGPGASSLGCIIATLTFTHGWWVTWINQLVPGGWSIAVEMNFYLMVPMLFRKVRSFQAAAIAAFGSLIAAGVLSEIVRRLLLRSLGEGAGISPTSIGLFVYYWLPMHLPVFFLGIALFFLVRPVLKGSDEPLPAWARPNPLFLLLLASYLMLALAMSDAKLFLHHALFSVAELLLCWSLALRPYRLLVNGLSRSFGQISFSGYITHFAVLDQTLRLLQAAPGGAWSRLPPIAQFVALVVCSLAGTWVVASITYRLIEVPGQAVGKWLIARLESRVSPPEPAAI